MRSTWSIELECGCGQVEVFDPAGLKTFECWSCEEHANLKLKEIRGLDKGLRTLLALRSVSGNEQLAIFD